jgi:hypothetical protein
MEVVASKGDGVLEGGTETEEILICPESPDQHRIEIFSGSFSSIKLLQFFLNNLAC